MIRDWQDKTDSELVRAALAGQSRAADALWRRHEPQARRVALRCTSTDVAADAATRTGMTLAFAQLATLDDPARFRPWLCGLVRSVATDDQCQLVRDATIGDLARAAQVGLDPAPATDGAGSKARARLSYFALPERYRRVADLAWRDPRPGAEAMTGWSKDRSVRVRRTVGPAAWAGLRGHGPLVPAGLGALSLAAVVALLVVTLGSTGGGAVRISNAAGVTQPGGAVNVRSAGSGSAGSTLPPSSAPPSSAGGGASPGGASGGNSGGHSSAGGTPGAVGATGSGSAVPIPSHRKATTPATSKISSPSSSLGGSTTPTGGATPATRRTTPKTRPPTTTTTTAPVTTTTTVPASTTTTSTTIPATTTTTAAPTTTTTTTIPPTTTTTTIPPTTTTTLPTAGTIPTKGSGLAPKPRLTGLLPRPKTPRVRIQKHAPVPAGAVLLTGNATPGDAYGAGHADGVWVGAPAYQTGPTSGTEAFSFGAGSGLQVAADPLGSQDFTVSFDLDTTEVAGPVDLLGNRSVCGPGSFFDVRLGATGATEAASPGQLLVEFDGVAPSATDPDPTATPVELVSSTAVADGNWHQIQVTRDGTDLSLRVDGTVEASAALPDGDSVTDPASSWQVANGDPCIGQDGTTAYAGGLADIYFGPPSSAPAPAAQSAPAQPSARIRERHGMHRSMRRGAGRRA